MDNGSLAIFWDVENVSPSLFAVEDLVTKLTEYGKIMVRKAFADWKLISENVARELVMNEFNLHHLPHARNFKNSSDIMMSVYLLDLSYYSPEVDTYVLITKDKDFRAIITNLHDKQKQVILVCDRSLTSSMLMDIADEIIDYSNFMVDIEEDEFDELEVGEDNTQDLIFEKLSDAIIRELEIEETDEVIHHNVLKRLLLLYEPLNTDKDEILRGLGISKTKWFRQLLEQAEKRGILSMRKEGIVYYISKGKAIKSKLDKYLNYALEYIKEKKEVSLTSLALHLANKFGSGYYKSILGFSNLPTCMNEGVNRGLFKMELDNETRIYDLWI